MKIVLVLEFMFLRTVKKRTRI